MVRMNKDQPIPFALGQVVEAKSFMEGYRGAWFRAKILKTSYRGLRAGHVLDYIDYPDEKKIWSESYQVPPNPDGSSGESRVLMSRPAYPPLYHKDKLADTTTGSDMVVVVEGGWRVGDLVDWLKDDCYWMGRLIEITDNETAKIELLPLPFGEGGIYVAQLSHLRPTLDWSPESGWTVPTPEGASDFQQHVQLMYPEKQTAGSGSNDKGKAPVNAGGSTETSELPENLSSILAEKSTKTKVAIKDMEEVANKRTWLKEILRRGKLPE